jgi:molybdopterin/thiamine biosynthesis adenylyltransferase
MESAQNIAAIFSRNIGTITRAQQLRLQQASVTVIGCGGLGCFVIEELARLGIGSLRICDPDTFTPSNLNRQLYAHNTTIGQYKADAAAERIQSIQSLTDVLALRTIFQESESPLFTDTEVVVDCLDNAIGRLELAKLCNNKKLPLVHGAVDQWYGQVGVQLAGGHLIRALYGETTEDKTDSPSVLSCTVAVIASLQVAETCKLLLGMKSPLHNNWMSIDLRRMTFETAGC